MKSFLYEIPAEYMPAFKVITPYRIKVLHEMGNVEELRMSPELFTMIWPTLWRKINHEIEAEAKRLWEESKASVDITPGDGCEHSDQMIP